MYAFDILKLNDISLIETQILDRKKELNSHFLINNEVFQIHSFIKMDFKGAQFIKEIKAHYEAAINNSFEGLFIKYSGTDSSYEIGGSRTQWIKVKKITDDLIGDYLDLVPLGAYYGTGNRRGLLGSFLMGVKVFEHNLYQPICKLGTGFSVELLGNLTKVLKKLEIPMQDDHVQTSMIPNVWVKPKMVWEVSYAQLTRSSKYMIGSENRVGISLRFPSLQRIRYDKFATEATDSNQVIDLFNRIKSKT